MTPTLPSDVRDAAQAAALHALTENDPAQLGTPERTEQDDMASDVADAVLIAMFGEEFAPTASIAGWVDTAASCHRAIAPDGHFATAWGVQHRDSIGWPITSWFEDRQRAQTFLDGLPTDQRPAAVLVSLEGLSVTQHPATARS